MTITIPVERHWCVAAFELRTPLDVVVRDKSGRLPDVAESN